MKYDIKTQLDFSHLQQSILASWSYLNMAMSSNNELPSSESVNVKSTLCDQHSQTADNSLVIAHLSLCDQHSQTADNSLVIAHLSLCDQHSQTADNSLVIANLSVPTHCQAHPCRMY